MKKYTKSLLIALVLGDGCISGNNTLYLSHSKKQLDYLNWKRELISKLLNCPIPGIYHRKDTKHDEYTSNKSHRYFRILKNWLYKNGEKRFLYKVINHIDAQGLAIWFMDDGTHTVNRRKSSGKIMSHTFKLYTMCKYEDVQDIMKVLKEKFGLNTYPLKYKRKDGQLRYYLQWKTREGRKFSNLVRPYILPSLQYKILREDEC